MEWILEFLRSTYFTNLIALLFGSGTVIGVAVSYLKTFKNRKLQIELDSLKEDKEDMQDVTVLLIAISEALLDTNIAVSTKARLKNHVDGVARKGKVIRDKLYNKADEVTEKIEVAKEDAKKIIERFTKT